MARKAFHEKLLMLARAQGTTQTEIAESLDMQLSHINRYFNGHSDISSNHLVNIMKTLGIDLEAIISKELLRQAGGEDTTVNDLPASVDYLLNSLDAIGKQTLLSQILWAAKKTSKKRIPEKVEAIVRKELSLI